MSICTCVPQYKHITKYNVIGIFPLHDTHSGYQRFRNPFTLDYKHSDTDLYHTIIMKSLSILKTYMHIKTSFPVLPAECMYCM